MLTAVPPTRRRRSITSTFLSTFNKEKLAIEQTVESVNNATRQINSLMQESQTAFSPDELDKVSAKLADCVKRAGGDAQRGKRLLDELKKRSDELQSSNPRSDRLQPYKSQYMRLCKMYVDAMKEHQKSKVRRVMARRRALGSAVSADPVSSSEAAAPRSPTNAHCTHTPHSFRSKCARCSWTRLCAVQPSPMGAPRASQSCGIWPPKTLAASFVRPSWRRLVRKPSRPTQMRKAVPRMLRCLCAHLMR